MSKFSLYKGPDDYVDILSNLVNSLLTKGPIPKHWQGPLHPSPLATLDATHVFDFYSLDETADRY